MGDHACGNHRTHPAYHIERHSRHRGILSEHLGNPLVIIWGYQVAKRRICWGHHIWLHSCRKLHLPSGHINLADRSFGFIQSGLSRRDGVEHAQRCKMMRAEDVGRLLKSVAGNLVEHLRLSGHSAYDCNRNRKNVFSSENMFSFWIHKIRQKTLRKNYNPDLIISKNIHASGVLTI